MAERLKTNCLQTSMRRHKLELDKKDPDRQFPRRRARATDGRPPGTVCGDGEEAGDGTASAG